VFWQRAPTFDSFTRREQNVVKAQRKSPTLLAALIITVATGSTASETTL
jgi:hypothetical protein